MEKFINATLKNLTADDIDEMFGMLEDAGYSMDYLDAPYPDGTYKTEDMKNTDIVEAFMDVIKKVQEFKGELPIYEKTRVDYVLRGGFEKDYFSSWVESCSDYPMVCEIRDECDRIEGMIAMWERAVEKGYIDPEAGWANCELPSMEEPDLYWEQESDNRWVLFSHDEDGEENEIAEIYFEDGGYYWVEIGSDCGSEDFDTLAEAKADAEAYFNKH